MSINMLNSYSDTPFIAFRKETAMQLDPATLAIGAAGMIGILIVFGITGAFFWYYKALLKRVKFKGLMRDHRTDLKLLQKSLREMGFAHIGYFVLSITMLTAIIKTGTFTPDRDFYIIAGAALFFWFCIVPGRGVVVLRDMVNAIDTRSVVSDASALPAQAEPAQPRLIRSASA